MDAMGFRSLTTAMVVSLLSLTAARAATIHFAATLTGLGEVPPNATTAKGRATAILDTGSKVFQYRVTYSGLTGPAVAADFRGPAMPGQNAPPIITLKSLASPMTGEAFLTDGQIGDLLGEVWYFNIHTAAHPGGEIRGQLTMAP